MKKINIGYTITIDKHTTIKISDEDYEKLVNHNGDTFFEIENRIREQDSNYLSESIFVYNDDETIFMCY